MNHASSHITSVSASSHAAVFFRQALGIIFCLSTSNMLVAQQQGKEQVLGNSPERSLPKLSSAEAIARAAAETQLNTAQKAADPMYDRVKALHARHATYLEDYAAGNTRPFPNIVKKWPSYQAKIKELKPQYEAYTVADTPAQKDRLWMPLLDSLQPIGMILRNADHSGHTPIDLNDAQNDEQQQLVEAFNHLPGADTPGKLRLTTPEIVYTLKNLPVPIQFTAPVGTEIILRSEWGGTFPNQLPLIRLITNEQGIATTTWVSRGGAVAGCPIIYCSPELYGDGRIEISVRQLVPLPLEHVSPIFKTASSKAAQKTSILPKS